MKWILSFILFPVSITKIIFRELNGANQIKLIINKKGTIQVINNYFNIMPSSVKVNSVSKTLSNGKLSLTSDTNTIIMSWDSPLSNCSYMFNDLLYIEEIDLSSFNSTSILYMSYMFKNCTNLTKINFNGFTTSSVTNMQYLFSYCLELTSLDLNSFVTSQVTSMKCMFYNCQKLKYLKLGRFTNS